jgi:LysM repeat protein
VQWQNSRSAGHSSSMRVGLSGIGLQTTAKNFYIELETSSKYSFNTIKVLSSVGEPCFGLTLSLAQKQPVQQLQKRTGSVVQQQHHTVKKGETLYRISVNYNTTVEALKKENSLTSDIIEIGQDIRIPRNSRMNYKENEAVSASGFFVRKNDTLSVAKYRYVTLYNSMQPLTRIYVVRGKNEPSYNLSGFVLEKSMKGVIYHAIGVNGAKTSDFNRYPIFFDQLSELNPDLVIISLGTNESFGKWVSNNYMYELSLMIKNIRERNRNVPVLVMTPPPSMLRRNQPNTFIESYSKAMLQMDGCAVWDLFSGMGGISAPSDKNYAPLMAKDKIHYTRAGYRVQAEIFSSALLDAYNKYIKTNCN